MVPRTGSWRACLLTCKHVIMLTQKTTQKDIVVDAIEAYIAQKQESQALLDAANRSFAEWDNPEDAVYDHL
ncbi:MAG: hypothetical protein FJW39_18305 [Acidobacteria bacterium]|nr:hypothetical protein [Acidobacteriota bacterium]